MTPGNALGPAFQHMVNVLFKPFGLRKWLGLGFASALAYGGFHANGSSNSGGPGQHGGLGGPGQQMPPGFEPVVTWFESIPSWMLHHIMLVVVIGAALVLISIVLTWLSSVFKFVYTEQVVRGNGTIREPFARLKGLGTSFFLWELGFGLVVMVALAIIVGLPILSVWVLVHKVSWATKIAVSIVAGMIGVIILISWVITTIFARDFVLTAMYVRGIRVLDAWRVVLPMLKANVGQVILYLLILIALAIGIAIAEVILLLFVMLVLMIPIGLIVLIGYLIFTGAHLSWTPAVIGIAISLGFVVLLAVIYVMMCAIQPMVVFRRAYSLVVLGQADPTLATVPTGALPPYAEPRPGVE